MSVSLEDQSERIKFRMASLRRHMDRDARRIVANTNRLFDWKEYVRQFPKSVFAAGLIAGFAIGPRREVVPAVKLSQESIDELLAQRRSEQARPSTRSEMTSAAVRMLGGLALSGTSILLRKVIESYLNKSTVSIDSDAGGHQRRY